MFKSVIVAEDHESANASVQKTLKELDIAHVDYVYYCDDALTRIKKLAQAGQSYDLLITDLSFEEDDRKQKIKEGEALIVAARQLQPDLKVLVFSAEQNAVVISDLFDKVGINGYVRKARRDAQELKIALKNIFINKQHLPFEFRQAMRQINAQGFTSYDIIIISQLSKGTLLKDIPDYLQQKQIMPSGLSSVEKRLKQIKETLGIMKNEQLLMYCKEKGII